MQSDIDFHPIMFGFRYNYKIKLFNCMKKKLIKSPLSEITKVILGFIWQPRKSTEFNTILGKKINLPIHWMKGGLS